MDLAGAVLRARLGQAVRRARWGEDRTLVFDRAHRACVERMSDRVAQWHPSADDLFATDWIAVGLAGDVEKRP